MNLSFSELNFVDLTLTRLGFGGLACAHEGRLLCWLSLPAFPGNCARGLWTSPAMGKMHREDFCLTPSKPLLALCASSSPPFYSYLIIMLLCSIPFSSFFPLYFSTRGPLHCDFVPLFSNPPLPAIICSVLPIFNHVYSFSDPIFFSSQKKMLERAD